MLQLMLNRTKQRLEIQGLREGVPRTEQLGLL